MLLPRVLGCAALVIAGLTQPTTAEQIGPSFDCSAARQPLAQILCADPDLSQTDLRFAQAYFALLPQLDDAGKRDLKQEDLRFLDAAQQHCGVPPAGPTPAQSDALRKCVKDAYESQRSVWLLRLRPPFSEEASRPIERHIALQRLLQQLGFLSADAKVDGVYGAGTREAISRWQSAQGGNVTGVLSDADAQALEQGAPQDQATAINQSRVQNEPTTPKSPQTEAQRAQLETERARLAEEHRQANERVATSLAQYNEFVKKTDMQARPGANELVANPFIYQGKNVGVLGQFGMMLTKDRAIIYVQIPNALMRPGILISSVPLDTFRAEGETVMLVGQVLGKEDMDAPVLGRVPITHLKYIDAYHCRERGCADLLYWESQSARNTGR